MVAGEEGAHDEAGYHDFEDVCGVIPRETGKNQVTKTMKKTIASSSAEKSCRWEENNIVYSIKPLT